MEITVLGTASIGGVPEWDCACPNCEAARKNPAQRRTRSSYVEGSPSSLSHLFSMFLTLP